MNKTCHIISGHTTFDVRVFKKQCVSLAKNGYDVTLLCSDGDEDRTVNGVKITSIKKVPKGRFNRFFSSPKLFFKKAKEIDADVYHIHEPFLLGVGRKLKKRGKKVIFDSHEDYPAMILAKDYLPKIFRRLIAWIYGVYEKKCFKKFDAVITVTPAVTDRVKKYQPNVIMIMNTPIITDEIHPTFDKRQIIFPGLVAKLWKLEVSINALNSIENSKFIICACSSDEEYLKSLKKLAGWNKVIYKSKVPQGEVFELMSQSMCGIAIADYLPELGYNQGTLGNTKLFEYMMNGIPVICTDFVLWKNIVEKVHCGICVNANSEEEVSNALRYLFDNPDEARKMGENGRKAALEFYNWSIEEKKLLNVYKSMMN